VRASLTGRTAELERVAVEIFAHGLSTRDIEAAFRDASGASVPSRTAVSQVTERLWQAMRATDRVAALASRSTISGWAATSPSLKTAHCRVHRRLDYPASLGLGPSAAAVLSAGLE